MSSTLMQREYDRAPAYYLSVLNYVSYRLIPGGEDKIERVVDGISRDDAREMAALFFKLRLMDIAEREHASRLGQRSLPPSVELCSGVSQLYALHAQGIVRLRNDRDVVFSNFLRSIDRQMYFLLGDPRQRCNL